MSPSHLLRVVFTAAARKRFAVEASLEMHPATISVEHLVRNRLLIEATVRNHLVLSSGKLILPSGWMPTRVAN